jgi:para-nitrobenzyl esterase
MRSSIRLFCIAMAAAILPFGAAVAAPAKVQTRSGALEGASANGIVSFLGIPYAAPPVGALRWMPPAPPVSWAKPRQAKAFGPSCAQITTLGPFAGPANANEDCLYLNVFAPSGPAQKLPVLFWLHGGGHVDGRSNDYDPSKLVKAGLVVVTINYRLNLFGYLAHPALDGEGHPFGNYGALDQQAALRWVRDNIAAFGGDPGNVTIAGQSAGASSAGVNVLSPLARGLIHRAIFESGGYGPLIPLKFAEDKGAKFAAAAGCGTGAPAAVAGCLRKLPAQKIFELSGTASANGPYITGPMIDGRIVPGSAIEAYKAGRFNPVPVMNGMVADEGNFNIGITEFFSGPPRAAVTAADFKAYVAKTYGGNAGPGGAPPAFSKGTVEAVLAHYPLKNYSSPQLAQDALMTDPISCRSRRIAQILAPQVPVYDYQFDDTTAPTYFPDMPGYRSLAYHTADLQFLFAGYHGGPNGTPHPLSKAQAQLSDRMVAAWANFARSGNPNGKGDAPWPRFTGQDGKALYLSQNIPALSTFRDAAFAARHQCGFWQSILVY